MHSENDEVDTREHNELDSTLFDITFDNKNSFEDVALDNNWKSVGNGVLDYDESISKLEVKGTCETSDPAVIFPCLGPAV